MRERLEADLAETGARLAGKGLFDGDTGLLSLRWPGREEMLLAGGGKDTSRLLPLAPDSGDVGLHAAVYRVRDDVGAVLTGPASWSELLAEPNAAPPVLYDEQARHIGPVAPAVASTDLAGLRRALRGGSNVALYGERWACLGTTGQRVTLNAEVFEKCARAFALARASGRMLHTVPWWVRLIAGSRLRRDQKRAAESLARGEIPRRVSAY